MMQSCIDRAVGMCKGHKLNSSTTNSETSCTMDKESMSQDIVNMDKEPPLKKARYSHPEGLDGCEVKSSPVVGSSGMYMKPALSMENVTRAERFTGNSNDILTCEKWDLKPEISEISVLPLITSNPEQCNHPEFNSKPRTMQIHHVLASDSSIISASLRRTKDDEVSDDDHDNNDDEASDASKLVLSVIKTKVDIQTMKMCLQHNAESSYRSSTLVNAVASSIAGASTGTTQASPQPLRGPQHASFAIAASSSGHAGPVEFSRAEPESVDHNGENLYRCNYSSSLICCSNTENLNPDPAARSITRLAHWQDQHTAKAIVDNAINRTIEEMIIAPDQAVPTAADEYEVDRIQCHGLAATAQQSVHHLQQRLQPMINQLTQASDLVFARNIEQSRDDLTGRGSMPSSPGVDTV